MWLRGWHEDGHRVILCRCDASKETAVAVMNKSGPDRWD